MISGSVDTEIVVNPLLSRDMRVLRAPSGIGKNVCPPSAHLQIDRARLRNRTTDLNFVRHIPLPRNIPAESVLHRP